MSELQDAKNALTQLADKDRAFQSQRYFKTAKGEYGEGDIFLGIRVPVLRDLAKQYSHLSLSNIQSLLKSRYHEQRLLALILLVNRFKKSDETVREKIFEIFISNTSYINNWDLVDTSAPHIVGAWLYDKDRSLLYDFSNSENLWERRIAVLACFHFIDKREFTDVINIAETLLDDTEDLIHKAVGWLLRELGKKNPTKLYHFLDKYAVKMPRTMLRYALEKTPTKKRREYMDMKSRSTVVKSYDFVK